MLKMKRAILWIIPVTIVVIAAIALVVIPAMGAHAATIVPDLQWSH